MLNMWKRNLLIIAVCVALIVTMGMYTGADPVQMNRDPAAGEAYASAAIEHVWPHAPQLLAQPLANGADPEPALPNLPIERPAQPTSTPSPSPRMDPNIAPSLSSHPSASSSMFTMQEAARAQHRLAAQSLAAESVDESPASSPYVVTAYYLNVRAEPNSRSAILRVAEKGDRLHVLQAEGNGWLKLQDDGYVHGDYVVPAEDAEQAEAASSSIRTEQPKHAQEVAIASAAAMPAVRKHAPGEPKKPTSTVKVESGLTEAHIAEIFEGTALEGHHLEQAILEVEETYGINAYFTIAVMKLESGNGKSKLAKEKNNLFGLNAVGNSTKKAYAFETKADSVHKFGELISKSYVGKGYTTIEKVARKYCPANPKWASLVKKIMQGDYRKL